MCEVFCSFFNVRALLLLSKYYLPQKGVSTDIGTVRATLQQLVHFSLHALNVEASAYVHLL